MSNCKIIAVSLEKGGVGKTATTLNLGAALARAGKRVLLVDFDPQSSLTVSLGLAPEDHIENIAALMRDAISEKPIDASAAIVRKESMDVISGHIELSAVELSLSGVFCDHFLGSILTPVRARYDYILIDCAPSLGMLTINALAAADSVLIPMQAQYLSAKGVELLLGVIFKMRKRINPNLAIEGILITMRDRRTRHGREMVEAIKAAYGGNMRIFETEIPASVRVSEAAAAGVSIFTHDPVGGVARAYAALACEVDNAGCMEARDA